MAVFNFGSINIDHVYQVPHFVQPGETLSSSSYKSVLGGKGANQSIALAKSGTKTYHIGAINKNDEHVVTQLKSAGVDCSLMSYHESIASGHAIIQVDQQAENSILLYGGANHQFESKQLNDALEKATTEDWLLVQNETNALETAIELAYNKEMQIAFNPAPMSDSVNWLPLDRVDVFIVNEIEAKQLSGESNLTEIKRSLLDKFGTSQFVITLGKKGVCYFDGKQDISVPGFEVKAIDTTAAGDTFTGYFLTELIKRNEIKQALKTASAAAAIAVTRSGAATSIPEYKEVAEFLSNINTI